MKKTPLIVVIIVLILSILGVLAYKLIKINKIAQNITLDENYEQKIEELVKNSDEKNFKYEYEKLNFVLNDDDTKKYVEISVSEKNKMKYASHEDIINLLKEGTGIIYFGFPECPWCRRTLPVFLNTIKDYNVDKIYYYNALNLRDTKHLDEEGNIITDKEGDPKYYEILDLLGDNIGTYNGLNDSSIKRLYFPTYVFVKAGNIIGVQISSVDSYTSTKEDMTDTQKEELSNIFKGYLEKIYTKLTCNEETTEAC